MRRIDFHPGWLLAIGLVAITCLAAGAGIGRAWEDWLDYTRRRRWTEETRRNPSARWAKMMQAESTAMARHDTSAHAVLREPVELRRVQGGQHCAVPYLFEGPMRESLLIV